MRLIDPTAAKLEAGIAQVVATANMNKRSANRRLDLDASKLAAHILNTAAGAFDANGGTKASSYVNTNTVAFAAVWFTNDKNQKVVRVRAELVRIKSENAVVDAPYAAPANVVEGLLLSEAYPVLCFSRLAWLYANLAKFDTPMSQAVYEKPGCVTGWLALADAIDEAGIPATGDIIRECVAVKEVEAQ